MNEYLFQDAEIADYVAQYISGDSELTNQGVDPTYNGKDGDTERHYPEAAADNYTGSYGAYRIPKTGWIEFTLPSLAGLKSNMYCTGSRTVAVEWRYADDDEAHTAKKDIKKGTTAVDIADIIGKTDNRQIVVRITNEKNSGDLWLTDLTIKAYKDISSGITGTDAGRSGFDMYQLDNALIVYGDMASLRIYTVGGKLVSSSRMSQYVSTANLGRGIYIVVATAKDGTRMSKKFVRK